MLGSKTPIIHFKSHPKNDICHTETPEISSSYSVSHKTGRKGQSEGHSSPVQYQVLCGPYAERAAF